MLEICSFHRGAVATSVASPRKLSAASPSCPRALTIDPQSHRPGIPAGNSFGMTSFAKAEIEKRPSIPGPNSNPGIICKLAGFRQEATNCFRITSLSNVNLQPLWNHIVHKKGGGEGPLWGAQKSANRLSFCALTKSALAAPNVYSSRQRDLLHAC